MAPPECYLSLPCITDAHRLAPSPTTRTGRTLAVRDSDRVMGVASRLWAAEVIE
jgi:hypothetical protein